MPTASSGNVPIYGKFLKRVNRFTCLVEVGESRKLAYLPNSGRLWQVLIPEARVILIPKRSGLPFKLVAVKYGNIWVSVDSHLVNDLFLEMFKSNSLPFLDGWELEKREKTIGKRRLDFIFTKGDEKLLVEVKSCTLVVNGVALFPDSPTQRGVEHLNILMENAKRGNQSIIVFVAQREDARSFAPNSSVHPEFAAKLFEALRKGVKAYLIVAQFIPHTISLTPLFWKELSIRDILTSQALITGRYD